MELTASSGTKTQCNPLDQVAADEESQEQLVELLVERLRESEARAEQARQQAEEASRAKSQFLAVMSHELRTPLNVVLGFVDLLGAELAGPLTEQQREHLTRIQASAWDLLDLIDRVLCLARIEAGREEVCREPVDVALLARESAELIAPAASRKGLRLDICALPALPMTTDPDKVRQILLNLLTNAIKYTDRGTVELKLEGPEDGWVRIRVRDTGIGIAPAQQARIFEPFAQVDLSSSRGRGGSGLGLSVTRELARLLAGEVAVASEPGRGSTFTVRLPC